MDIQFSVQFLYKDNNIEDVSMNFYDENVFINEQYIKENKLVDIKFECDNNEARLYMDGLEMLPERFVNTDENGSLFLKPSKEIVPFYNIDLYPLIPGTYTMKVEIGAEKYYSTYSVIGKLLSNEEIVEIRKDLEDEISGLAFDLMRRNISNGSEMVIENFPKDMYKFYLIKDNIRIISSALMDLKIRPNYQIKKVYINKLQENAGELDNKAIRVYLSEKNKPSFVKVPIKKINYDLAENRWIKKIIEEFLKVLREFIEASENYLQEQNRKLQKEMNIGFYKKENILENKKYVMNLIVIAKKIKSILNVTKNTEWYKSLSDKKEVRISNVLMQDARYSSLYRVYRKLKEKNFSIQIDERFSLQWKRTDYLYEMWSFIKVCKIIEKLDFKIQGEWINLLIRNKNVLIPEIQSGTKIEFIKENIRMSLVYDQKIPYKSSRTDVYENPLYAIQPNNRPDGRLDVYIEGVYQGSIVFEFKYRDKKNLWNERYIEKFNEVKVIKQLISYSTFKSIYYKGMKENKSIRSTPVFKVIALYPQSQEYNKELDEIKDTNITFLKFRPKINEERLSNYIREIVEEIIEE